MSAPARYQRVPTDAETVALAMLVNAAERGDACPSNYEIAAAVGAATASRSTEIINRLEKRGLIQIERGQTSRVVTIVETGKRTGGKIGAVHWRYRPENIHRKRIRYSNYRNAVPAEMIPPPKMLPATVDREPCFMCGVRGDIGCQHRRLDQ